MKAKSILLLFMAVIFSSCKNDKTDKDAESKTFKVTVKVIAKNDDDFCLLYTTDGTCNFNDKVVWQHVKGNNDEQEVAFSLPSNIKPTQLRLDFGIKKEQDEIVLKKMTFEYNNKKKEIQGDELRLLFRPDDSKCTFDGTTGVIKAITKDGQKQIPSIYPQEANLGPVLKKFMN
jgi:hypothetical protein